MNQLKTTSKILLSIVMFPVITFGLGLLSYFFNLVLFCNFELLGENPPSWLIECSGLTEPGTFLMIIIPVISIGLGIFGVYGFFWKR